MSLAYHSRNCLKLVLLQKFFDLLLFAIHTREYSQLGSRNLSCGNHFKSGLIETSHFITGLSIRGRI
ncbi:hypothetical protein N184_29505 [Sinorhizobium sp. GL28]|nr:hypothetical protein N184_29505 [Sinorhizobium sp. GL28]